MRLFAIIALLLCIFGAVNAFLKKRRLLALNWPGKLSHSQFAAWVTRYLKHHGWKVETPELAVHVITAKRAKEVVRIFTECSLVEYNPSRVKDITREALMRKPHPLVCINARPVPAYLMSAAASGQALVVYYKELDLIFDESVTDQKDLLETMRIARLERLSAEAEPPQTI